MNKNDENCPFLTDKKFQSLYNTMKDNDDVSLNDYDNKLN